MDPTMTMLFHVLFVLLWTLSTITALSIPTTTTTTTTQQQHVVVVGAGIGGLAVACRIAAAAQQQQQQQQDHDDKTTSVQVTVLEKNTHTGGRCGSTTGLFRHERGPSLLLLKDVYESLFADCCGGTTTVGSQSNQPTTVQQIMANFGLEIRQCLPAYQVVFDDGDCLEVGFPKVPTTPSSSSLLLQQREEQSRQQMNTYETNGATKWDEYLNTAAAFLDCGLPNFIQERLDLSSFPTFLYQSLRDKAKAWPLLPHSTVLDNLFESTKLQALASFQNLYVGLQPYCDETQIGGGVLCKTAPAVFALLAAIELHPQNENAGVYAPIGGFQAVTDAVEQLALSFSNVQIKTNVTVTKVTKDGVWMTCSSSSNDEEQKGDEQFVPANLVVVNADLPYATKTIMNNDNDTVSNSNDNTPPQQKGPSESFPMDRYDWDDRFDYSSGVIAFHWSVDCQLEDLNTHNVFLVASSRDAAEQSWRCLRAPQDKSSDLEPFNFYVHRPTHTDPTAAPLGCDAITVLVPCSTLQRIPECAHRTRDEAIRQYHDQFDDSVINHARDRVLRRLAKIESLQNLANHIVEEMVDTPATYANQYNVAAGTPFALSHGFGQLSLTRPGHESQTHPNVLHVGASSRPGNGVPLVLIGAQQVAEKALRRLQQQQKVAKDATD